MTTFFVSRHPGAVEWAATQGIVVDRVVDHLDVATLRTGDLVIGTLPVNLVADVCARGGRYLHLTLELRADMRGQELRAEDMRAFGARIEEYRVERIQC
jgi:CRISPR-associated protein Csx16